VVMLGENHLRRVLRAYAAYYNGFRTHLSLRKDAPTHPPIQRLGRLVARSILGGLIANIAGRMLNEASPDCR
jgi:hypothetical protein